MQHRISFCLSVLVLAFTAFLGCSRTSGGSESNFVVCAKDADCASGTCVNERCTDSARRDAGAAGSTDRDATVSTGGAAASKGGAGGAAASFGGAGGFTAHDAGCSAGGVYTFPGGAPGSSDGGAAGAPACPDGGVTTLDRNAMCAAYRCPAYAADLLTGLTCNEVATDRDGITTTSGCGAQTVRISGGGIDYEAYFDQSQGGSSRFE